MLKYFLVMLILVQGHLIPELPIDYELYKDNRASIFITSGLVKCFHRVDKIDSTYYYTFILENDTDKDLTISYTLLNKINDQLPSIYEIEAHKSVTIKYETSYRPFLYEESEFKVLSDDKIPNDYLKKQGITVDSTHCKSLYWKSMYFAGPMPSFNERK